MQDTAIDFFRTETSVGFVLGLTRLLPAFGQYGTQEAVGARQRQAISIALMEKFAREICLVWNPRVLRLRDVLEEIKDKMIPVLKQ